MLFVKTFSVFLLIGILTGCSWIDYNSVYTRKYASPEQPQPKQHASNGNFTEQHTTDTTLIDVNFWDSDSYSISVGPAYLPVIPTFFIDFPRQLINRRRLARLTLQCLTYRQELLKPELFQPRLVADEQDTVSVYGSPHFTYSPMYLNDSVRKYNGYCEFYFTLKTPVKKTVALIFYNPLAEKNQTVVFAKTHKLAFVKYISN